MTDKGQCVTVHSWDILVSSLYVHVRISFILHVLFYHYLDVYPTKPGFVAIPAQKPEYYIIWGVGGTWGGCSIM